MESAEGIYLEEREIFWGTDMAKGEENKKINEQNMEGEERPPMVRHYEMVMSAQQIGRWKRSAWAKPLLPTLPSTMQLPMAPVGSQPRQPPPGYLDLQSSVQCDACANIIAQGSILRCKDMTYHFSKCYPIKHYLNCPKCSAEMVIETVEGKPGFKSLVGATEYSGPVDERNKVIQEVPRKILTLETVLGSK